MLDYNIMSLPSAPALELSTETTTLLSTVPLVNSTQMVWTPSPSRTVYSAISNDTVTAEEWEDNRE